MPMTPSIPEKPLTDEEKAQWTSRLFDEIRSSIKNGDIPEAEKLREKLMAVNPTALNKIIESAELIEIAKTAGLDKKHLALWEKLYCTLSTEERNCHFFSLKEVVLAPGKIILSRGSFNTRLFFIESGQVNIYLPQKDKHVLLAELGPGDIIGEYTFATISLCSATAVSHTEVHLRYLESQAADNWSKNFPGLYDKLIDFCIRYGRVDEIIKRKNLEKRTSVRYAIEGRVTAVVLDKEGQKTDSHFRGSLSDISISGTCFLVKLSKKSTARALLARHLSLDFSFEKNGREIHFSAVGKVVGVSFHMYNDYSVHIHFTKELQEELIQKALF